MEVKPNNQISQLTWVILCALGFILFVGAAVVLMTVSNKSGDIKPQVFYFLLVLIGLIASGFLFGALKSHAKYTGKVYNGTLELGGPTVLFIIVIYMGIKFSSPAGSFTLRFNVFGSADKSELINKGMLKVLFNKPDSADIINGTVEFTDVSTGLQGKKITVIAAANDFYVAAQDVTVPNSSTPIEIHLKRKPYQTLLSGIVMDVNGQPVSNASIMIADGLYTCKTDAYGNFKLTIPVKEGTELPVRIYYRNKLCYNNTQMLSAQVPLTLQLH